VKDSPAGQEVVNNNSISLSYLSLSPGHTALYSLITAKSHQNVISHETDKIKQIKQNNQIDYFHFFFFFFFFFSYPDFEKNYLI
jgi:hypothetical protein